MKIFETFNLSGLNLSSRIVMAPLTRRRATDYNVPVPMMAEYYGQRAGAGLIIAEGTSPSQNGVGYCNMPALYNLEHAKAWKKTTTLFFYYFPKCILVFSLVVLSLS